MKVFVIASVVGLALVGSSLVAACSSDPADTTDGGTASDSATPATDSATSTDASTQRDTSTSTGDAAVAPTFSNVYTTVIEGACNGCHAANHSTGLDMSTKAAAYTNLVGKASGAGGTSTSCTGKTRVVASDPATSLFWTKIDHTAGCGNPMPLAGSKLSGAKIQLVKDWIQAGAKND